MSSLSVQKSVDYFKTLLGYYVHELKELDDDREEDMREKCRQACLVVLNHLETEENVIQFFVKLALEADEAEVVEEDEDEDLFLSFLIDTPVHYFSHAFMVRVLTALLTANSYQVVVFVQETSERITFRPETIEAISVALWKHDELMALEEFLTNCSEQNERPFETSLLRSLFPSVSIASVEQFRIFLLLFSYVVKAGYTKEDLDCLYRYVPVYANDIIVAYYFDKMFTFCFPEKILEELVERLFAHLPHVVWQTISRCQRLSVHFMFRYRNFIDWEEAAKSQVIPDVVYGKYTPERGETQEVRQQMITSLVKRMKLHETYREGRTMKQRRLYKTLNKTSHVVRDVHPVTNEEQVIFEEERVNPFYRPVRSVIPVRPFTNGRRNRVPSELYDESSRRAGVMSEEVVQNIVTFL